MSRSHEPHSELSPDDQRLLDQLVEANFDPQAMEPLTPAERRRVSALVSLLGLLSDYPVDDADDTLVYATLARIDRREEERTARMTLGPETSEIRRGRRIHIPDFITVAAVMLIAASVLWPLMSHARRASIDEGCNNNLRALGYAFSTYAADYDGAVPVAMMAGSHLSWDTVRNVLNLAPLIDKDYCEQSHLDCPGNDIHYRTSYSYQWQLPSFRLTWDANPTMVVLGDRNPVIDAARRGTIVAPLTVSLNHSERGQNVLFSDGSTPWIEKPVVGRDNIWLPEGANSLRKGQNPKNANDVFLAH